MLELIHKTRSSIELSSQELTYISEGAARHDIPDYQLSAWLMAVFCRGLSERETADFTKAMAASGRRMNFKAVKMPKIDKHSTGGVGDGISLALAPLVASCGVAVPMMSGRGLGHTGGTLDKLESIKGFKVSLSPGHILRQLKSIGVGMFGQTGVLAPADKKLYSLRDATATIESLPLIVASILSKKYAEGLDALLLDVKYGSGAFLKDFDRSRKLAQALVRTGNRLGMRSVAILTSMEQPLGRAVGNALELEQSIRILHGDRSVKDFSRILGVLGGWMLYLGRKSRSPKEGTEKLESAIRSGAALKKMRDMIRWQGGDPRVADYPDRYLPKARLMTEVKAPKAGYISVLDARTVGNAGVLLGGGRQKMTDSIDYGAGILLEKKMGDRVKPGDVVAKLYSSQRTKLADGKKEFIKSFKVAGRPPRLAPLVKEVVK